MMMHEDLKKISKKRASCSSKVHLFHGILLMRFGRSARTFRKDVAGLPRTPSRSVETKHSLSREGEETSLRSSSIAHRIFFFFCNSLFLSSANHHRLVAEFSGECRWCYYCEGFRFVCNHHSHCSRISALVAFFVLEIMDGKCDLHVL